METRVDSTGVRLRTYTDLLVLLVINWLAFFSSLYLLEEHYLLEKVGEQHVIGHCLNY